MKRTDLDLADPKAQGLAVADNRVAELGLRATAEFPPQAGCATMFFDSPLSVEILSDENVRTGCNSCAKLEV